MRPFGGLLIGLALLRAGIGLFILVVFHPHDQIIAGVCLVAFAAAQFTDQLDGWIARRYSKPSIEGYLQDSVSDKLLHIGCLLAFAKYYAWVGVLVWLVCVREISILATRVVVSNLPKTLKRYRRQSITYALALRLSIAMFLLLPFAPTEPNVFLAFSHGLLALACALGVWNMIAVVRGTARVGSRQP